MAAPVPFAPNKVQGKNALTGWYHADGYGTLTLDGTGDNTAPIQAAVTAAAAEYAATGRQQTVHMPPGTFRHTTKLVPASGVRLKGSGQYTTTLAPSYADSSISYIGTASAPLANAEFADFGIDGVNQPGSSYLVSVKGIFNQFHDSVVYRNLYIRNTQASGLGVDFFHGNCVIDNVITNNCGRLNNGTGPGGNGIGLGIGGFTDGYDTVVVTNSAGIGSGRFGIMVETQDPSKSCKGVRIIGNLARGNQIGIVDAGAEGAIISGNQSISNTSHGIGINAGTFATPAPGYRGQIKDNHCTGNGGDGINLDLSVKLPTGSGYTIAGNHCIANTGNGIKVALGALGSTFHGLRILDNTCTGNTANGIALGANTDGSTTTLTDCEILNNKIAGNLGGLNLFISANTVGLVVRGNKISDRTGAASPSTGIYLNSGYTFTDTVCENNDVSAVTNPITFSGGTSAMLGKRRFANNLGYNPVGPIARTVGSSPWTYQTFYVRETLYVSGGTVSNVTKGGVTLPYNANGTAYDIDPGDSIIVTYSAAPTAVADRH